jgi:hypothetical protein
MNGLRNDSKMSHYRYVNTDIDGCRTGNAVIAWAIYFARFIIHLGHMVVCSSLRKIRNMKFDILPPS